MASLIPNRKVNVGALSAAIAALSFWSIDVFYDIKAPAELAVTVAGGLTYILQYLIPEPNNA